MYFILKHAPFWRYAAVKNKKEPTLRQLFLNF